MPHKDKEIRKEYLRQYYLKNSDTIKKSSQRTRQTNQERDPSYYSDLYNKYKDYDKRSKHLRRYGITPEEYDKMFVEQCGCCKICHRPQSAFKKGLAVDHCHSTKKVRGLLCVSCNTALGHFRDSIESLEEAVKYLKEAEHG